MKRIALISYVLLIAFVAQAQPRIWSKEKANQWYAKQPWLVGCNFIPSTAINELEMWQAESFDTSTISRELGWAHNIGMNIVRVFLHNIPWEQDSASFIQRINTYLTIADKHQIKTMFVLFDDCWNNDPHAGQQPAPKPGIHNSGWMQIPGIAMHNDSSTWGKLESYTKGILTAFANDKRVLIWDLYNEPGNSQYNETSLPLLKDVFSWAWTVRPSQPLTCGIWYVNAAFTNYQLNNSDIISFHNYDDTDRLQHQIDTLRKYNRPLICSEYMARTRKSTFQTHLPIFKKNRVAAINWGLVAGKTNTIYQWDTPMPNGDEPKLWFHDVFRKDGTPYKKEETDFIKKITARK